MLSQSESETKVRISGLLSEINQVFGSNLAYTPSSMFGDVPVIDDKLLYQIANVVYAAVSDSHISKEAGQEIMGSVYEYHSNINYDRAIRMTKKGEILAYKALKSSYIRNGILYFCKKWGSFDNSAEAVEKTEKLRTRRMKLLQGVFKRKLVPAFIKMEDLKTVPEISFVYMVGASGKIADTDSLIDSGKFSLKINFYVDENSLLKRDAVDWLSTLVHELHHCGQYQKFYDIRMKSDNYWCLPKQGGKVPEEVLYVRLKYVGNNQQAMLNSPLEQEAYTVQTAFDNSVRDFLKLTDRQTRKGFVNNLNGYDAERIIRVYNDVSEMLNVR